MFRSRISFLLPTVALLLSAIACGSSSASKGGDDNHAGNSLTLRIGDQNKQLAEPLELSGQLKSIRYSVQWSNFLDGPHMDAAFAAGKIDVGFLGDSPALLATASGADSVVVAATRFAPNTFFVIVARPGSGINTLADLRGKKVAFTKATALHGYLLQSLGTVGLTQNDITTVDVPATSVGTTLESGNADAAVLTSFLLTNYLEQHPDAKVLSSPITSYCVLLATRHALADPAKKAAIYDLTARLAKAGTWVKAHPNTYIKDYLEGFQHQEPVAAQAGYKRTGAPLWIPPSNDVRQHQQAQAKLLVEVGVLPKGFDADGQFDAAATRGAESAMHSKGAS